MMKCVYHHKENVRQHCSKQGQERVHKKYENLASHGRHRFSTHSTLDQSLGSEICGAERFTPEFLTQDKPRLGTLAFKVGVQQVR
jgi:hypothetical protein